MLTDKILDHARGEAQNMGDYLSSLSVASGCAFVECARKLRDSKEASEDISEMAYLALGLIDLLNANIAKAKALYEEMLEVPENVEF